MLPEWWLSNSGQVAQREPEYSKYLLEHRPSKDMSDDELAKLAPWSEAIQEKCSNKHE